MYRVCHRLTAVILESMHGGCKGRANLQQINGLEILRGREVSAFVSRRIPPAVTREYPDSWASVVRLYGSSHPHFFSRKIQDGHLGPPFLLEIHEEAGLDLCHE